MKKNYLTLILSLTALSALTLQSFAMVPPPESLKAAKHRGQAKQVNPDTTVVASGKIAICPPIRPPLA